MIVLKPPRDLHIGNLLIEKKDLLYMGTWCSLAVNFYYFTFRLSNWIANL